MSKETEFSAFDPQTQVSDRIVNLVISVMAQSGIDVKALQRRHGLADLCPDGWHRQQQLLDLLKDVGELRLLGLMGLGSRLPLFINCQAGAISIAQVFDWLRSKYQECHRNGDAGYYETVQVDPRRIRLISHTPYPEILEYGLCLGLARRFAPSSAQSLVTACDTTLPFQGINKGYSIYAITW